MKNKHLKGGVEGSGSIKTSKSRESASESIKIQKNLNTLSFKISYREI